MKIVDERLGELSRYVKRVKVYPFLEQDQEDRMDGYIEVRVETPGPRDALVCFNINLREMTTERFGIFQRALFHVRKLANFDLLTNPELPLPEVDADGKD